jgi:flavin reductase (DIM6/NTAB) family NADH-FMN oxidoreductase RutF
MMPSAMFVSEDPSLLVLSVAKHSVSDDLIEKASEFVLT